MQVKRDIYMQIMSYSDIQETKQEPVTMQTLVLQ